MRQLFHRLAMVLVCAFICAGAIVSLPSPFRVTRTEDLNRDGRPDVWRSYGRDGRIARIARDTNFDGRSDVEEFYEDGALVRRESDRDFNDQVDLVQEFDPETRQIVRSVSDVNRDGVADLLVLFQDGRPVYQKWAQAMGAAYDAGVATPAARPADQSLVGLIDPFSADRAVKAVRTASSPGELAGPPSAGGTLAAGYRSSDLTNASSSLAFNSRAPAIEYSAPLTLRGPPCTL